MEFNPLIGTGGNAKSFLSKHVVIVVTVVVVLGAAGVVVVHQATKPKPNNTVATLIEDASTSAKQGNFEQAIAILKPAAAKTDYVPQKVTVYDELASDSSSAGKLQDALHFYDLKHKLDAKTAKVDAYTQGQIYERLGDKQQAIDRYTVAVQYKKSLPNAKSMTMEINTIQGQIDALKSGND